MITKLRSLYRKLDKRLMLIICMTVIPVNVLAIILSSFTVREAGQKIRVSYEKEFRAFMDRETAQLARLDAWYNNFVADELRYLSNERAFDAVKSIQLLNNASDMFDMYGVHGIILVKERQGDERLYAKSLKGLYDFDEFEQIKSGLAGFCKSDGPTSGWSIIRADERCYFLQTRSYVNYTLGIGIDIGKELDGWFGTELSENSRVLLTDGSKALICDGSDSLELMADETLDAYNGSSDTVLVASTADPRTGISARLYYGQLLTGQTSVYFFLQLLAWFSLAVLLVLWFVIRRQVIAPMKVLTHAMHALDGQDWDYRIPDTARTDDYDYIYTEFNKMAADIRQSHEKDMELYETQMNNLKLQVNPHMLLNSLTMIYSLAETKQYEIIQKYTMNLVEYFRYCLRENNSLVLLKSEIRFVENYLEIQKLRYPGQLSGVYMMPESLENALIPPLLIQNFVENATKYARMPERTIEVLINVHQEERKLMISVSDTGKGMDARLCQCLNAGELYVDRNGMKHIGIWNCRRRLELFFGNEASIHITSKAGEGTQVWMELPLQEASVTPAKEGERL